METECRIWSAATLTMDEESSPFIVATLIRFIPMLQKHSGGAITERLPMRLSFHQLWFSTYRWRLTFLAQVISMPTAIGTWSLRLVAEPNFICFRATEKETSRLQERSPCQVQ